MSSRFIIGVMGPGENATPDENELAFNLGSAIAKQGWITLTGGRAFGVMDAAMKGATEEGGLTIGVLPGDSEKGSSPHAGIKIITSMGGARNSINVLSSHVIVVCGMSAGTASEVALAIKADKRIILLNLDEVTIQFFKKIGTYKITLAKTIDETIALVKNFLSVYG
jgi:uncharacterized protein (TIGR00725 family)